MMSNKAFVIDNYEEGMKLKEISINSLQKNQVLIKQKAIGINFIDLEMASSRLNIKKFPIIPGIEAIGVVEEIGEDVFEFAPGQRVAYATAQSGAYASSRAINVELLSPVPDEIQDEEAMISLTKGMMAHALLRRVFFVNADHTILINAAAGAVGSHLVVLAKHYGAKVIAAVGSDEKKDIAKNLNADHVLNYNSDDFVKKVMEITNGLGVKVVYDSVGGDFIKKSLEITQKFGLIVQFGNSSGKYYKMDPMILSKKSLFLTAPRLHLYKQDRVEMIKTAVEVFYFIKKGIFAPIKHKIYNFEEIPAIHENIKSRSNIGSQVVKL